MRITMKDLLRAGVSPFGARQFFQTHGWDWGDFLRNGKDVSPDELLLIPDGFRERITTSSPSSTG